jgi:hypothetical protein
MGWVEDEFLDRAAYGRLTPRLWDSVRDSVGQSVIEFNTTMGSQFVELQGCTARGTFCFRIHNIDRDNNIEVFLDTGDLSLKAAVGRGKAIRVSSYRLMTGRSALEFFGDEGPLAVDQVCKKAISEFLFAPFPAIPKR